MPSTWEEIVKDEDFLKYRPSERLNIARGFYQWKTEKEGKLNLSEEDFVNAVKPDVYGKAGLFEAGTTGLLESAAGTIVSAEKLSSILNPPYIVAKHLLGIPSPSLEEVTQNLVGEERLQRAGNAGLAGTVARGLGHAVGELPKYVIAAKLTGGLSTIPLLGRIGSALKTATGLPSGLPGELAHQLGTFSLAGAYQGIGEGKILKRAAEGALMAVPFTGVNLAPRLVTRILGSAAVGGVMAGISGGKQKDIASSAIVMGVLGMLSKQVRDTINSPNISDKGIENVIKDTTGKSIEQLTEDFINKGLPNYKTLPIEGQPTELPPIPPVEPYRLTEPSPVEGQPISKIAEPTVTEAKGAGVKPEPPKAQEPPPKPEGISESEWKIISGDIKNTASDLIFWQSEAIKLFREKGVDATPLLDAVKKITTVHDKVEFLKSKVLEYRDKGGFLQDEFIKQFGEGKPSVIKEELPVGKIAEPVVKEPTNILIDIQEKIDNTTNFMKKGLVDEAYKSAKEAQSIIKALETLQPMDKYTKQMEDNGVNDIINIVEEGKQPTEVSKEFKDRKVTRVIEEGEKKTVSNERTQNEERAFLEQSAERRAAIANEINQLKANGVSESDPRMQKLLSEFAVKGPTVSGEPDLFKSFKSEEVPEGGRGKKELTEIELSKLTDAKNPERANDVKLSVGIDLPRIIEAIKMGKDVFEHLTKLSVRVFMDGAQSFKDFVYKMKGHLGDIFHQFASQMSKLFKQVKDNWTEYKKDIREGKDTTLNVFVDPFRLAIEFYDKINKKPSIQSKEGMEAKVKQFRKEYKGGSIKFSDELKNRIVDLNSELTKRGLGEYTGKDSSLRLPVSDIGAIKDTSKITSEPIPLNKVYQNFTVSKIYPELEAATIQESKTGFSYFVKDKNKIDIFIDKADVDIKENILHEVQHAIQKLSGFPSGSSTDIEFAKLYNKFTKEHPEIPTSIRKTVIKLWDEHINQKMDESFTDIRLKNIDKILERFIRPDDNLYDNSMSKTAFKNYETKSYGEIEARSAEKGYERDVKSPFEAWDKKDDLSFDDVSAKQRREVKSFDKIDEKNTVKFLDEESSLSERKLLDTLDPFIKGTMEKGSNVLDYISNTFREAFRVPLHSKYAKEVTKFWHNNIERRGNEVTNFARNKMKSFFELPKDVKEIMAKDGWVWDVSEVEKTPVELTSLGYTPDMITAYQGIRSGLEYMHGSFLNSELTKLFKNRMSEAELGKTVEGYNALPKDLQEKVRLGVASLKADKIIEQSKITGYLPRYRFGRYVVHITNAKGTTIWNEGFEAKYEAQKFLSEHPENSRIIDTKYEKVDAVEMMTIEKYIPLLKKVMGESGIPTEFIDRVSGSLDDQWLNVFASGKLANREGIPGYSKDLERALLTYTENFPKSVLKRFNAPELSDIVRKIPTADGQRAYAQDLVDYLHGRNNPEGKINRAARAYMYIHYLVGKPAFSLLNMTGRVTMTAPWTISEISRLKPGSSFWEATKSGWKYVADAQQKEIRIVEDLVTGVFDGKHLPDIIKGSDYLNIKEKSVLLHLERQGEFKAIRQTEIGGTEYEKWLNRIDMLGRLSERSNRIHAALTAINLYDNLGYEGSMGGRTSTRMKGLIDAVDEFISNTQILYSKANRPQIARGWKAPIFMFKNFMLGYMNLYYKMLGDKNKAAFTNGIAATLAIGGAAGVIPAREEIDKIVDGFMNTVVGDPSWPVTKQSYINSISDTKVSRALLYGIPSLIGIDASSMVGFPNISGSALLPIMQGALKLPENVFRRDMTTVEKFKTFLPSQANNLYKLYKITKYGLPTDRTGKPLIRPEDVTGLPYSTQQVAMKMYNELPKSLSVTDKMAMAFGFPSIAINKYYNDVYAIKSSKGSTNAKKAELHRAIALAIIDQDSKRVDNLFKEASQKGIKMNTETILGHIVAYEAQ